MYEGVKLGILYTANFDESPNLDTTFFGKENKTGSDKIKVEERFLISE